MATSQLRGERAWSPIMKTILESPEEARGWLLPICPEPPRQEETDLNISKSSGQTDGGQSLQAETSLPGACALPSAGLRTSQGVASTGARDQQDPPRRGRGRDYLTV